MNEAVYELLNQQIMHEFYSAYLYLDFADFFDAEGLKGYANWYRVQAQEELSHGMKFIHYLLENAEEVTLDTIQKPTWQGEETRTVQAVLRLGLNHEKHVTRLIEAICQKAEEVGDRRTLHFLDWFIAEQAEEESNANDMLTKFWLFGGDYSSLYLLDRELAGRTFSPDTAA